MNAHGGGRTGGQPGSRDTSAYLESLSRELKGVGIAGARQKRIVAEFADHLECDPNAELGDAAMIARTFADELGTAWARRAAIRAFAALAVAGLLFAAWGLLAARYYGGGRLAGSAAAQLVLGFGVVAGQVAFVSGGLGLLRAIRLRRQAVVSADEARVLVRRAGVGLFAGALTLLAVPVVASGAPGSAHPAWRTFGYVVCAVGVVTIVLAAPSVLASARVAPRAAGEAGDLFSDLGPLVPRWLAAAPWGFAVVIATALAMVLAASGALASDPYDGILRGLAEGTAVLAGFALLGGYLGLRTGHHSS